MTTAPKAAIGFIFVTVVLDVLAGSLIGPVLPRLLQSLTGGSMAQMSGVFGAMMMLYAAMQLFAGPVQGALSDRFGRRPVILVSNFGLGLDFIIMALAPNLAWLFVGRAITGAAAGSMTAAYAYVADVTEPDKLAARLGLLAAAISTGAALGPMLGGLLGEISPRAPFWAAAALSLLNGLYGLVVLPESLPRKQRAKLTWRTIHPIGAVTSIWRDYPAMKIWHAASFLMGFGIMGVNSIFLLYVTFRYGWTPAIIGAYSTFVVLTGLAVQSGLVGRTIKWLGEARTYIAGTVIQIIAIVAAGLAVTGWQFVAAVFLMMLGGVSGPAVGAILNRMVGPSDRGRLSGAGRSIASLTGIAAPGIFAALFAALMSGGATNLRYGAPFYICAVLMVLGLWVNMTVLRRTPPSTSPDAGPA